jgi:thiopeptide-type bacteriocin biosynthesis protein
MSTRATPFGLLATISLGTVGGATSLRLAARAESRRATRLDMHYLCVLADALERVPGIRRALVYVPSNGLHRVAGGYRHLEMRTDANTRARTAHVVAFDRSAEIDAVLERAEGGARPGELASALVDRDPDLDREEALGFVDEMMDAGLLASDLVPRITGAADPLGEMAASLAEIPEGERAASVLRAVRSSLADLDRAGIGSPIARYHDVAGALAALPAEIDLHRLFQVDLHRPAQASIDPALAAELSRAVQTLHSISRPATDGVLERCAQAFAARFGDQESPADVPLAVLLDDDLGIPLGDAVASEDASPLLAGLDLAPRAIADAPRGWGPRETHLAARIDDVRRDGGNELVLGDDDLRALAPGRHAPLPDAFAVFAGLGTADGEARIWLHGAAGPSGAELLGRFCSADEVLLAHVRAHLEREERLRPDAIFAEVVHLPEGRVGNILARPILRAYEIPYLARSGAPADRRIAIDDLFVRLDRGRLSLRSARLGREILPRLTAAHAFAHAHSSIYRFLCALQSQGTAGAVWDWGALAELPFLPRVRLGRTVFAAARWQLGRGDLAPLRRAKSDGDRIRSLRALRQRRGIPRTLLLADGDQRLLVDCENPVSVEGFAAALASRDRATLIEPAGLHGVCVGPEGRFAAEVIVPFVRRARPRAAPRPTTGRAPAAAFAPGSEWLYAKLYTGSAAADAVLTEIVAPLVARAVEDGTADRWFFVRYGDPDWHVRLRVHGERARLLAEIVPALHDLVRPWLTDGRVFRVQLDTYQPEVHRYGGPSALPAVERVFHADSDAVLAILEASGDEVIGVRWKLALYGAHLYFEAFAVALRDRVATLSSWRDALAREHRLDVLGRLGARFRAERAELESMIAGSVEGELATGCAILDERSARLGPAIRDLRALERRGALEGAATDLLEGFVHMHVNRVLRSAHRTHELVLYDFLARIYASDRARHGPRAGGG